jgi:hypothetical protein
VTIVAAHPHQRTDTTTEDSTAIDQDRNATTTVRQAKIPTCRRIRSKIDVSTSATCRTMSSGTTSRTLCAKVRQRT